MASVGRLETAGTDLSLTTIESFIHQEEIFER